MFDKIHNKISLIDIILILSNFRFWCKELYKDNLSLHKELSKQSKVVDEAVKYQKERDIILADNKSLHSQVENIKTEYKEKEFDLDWNYKKQIEHEEKEKELSYER